MTSFDVVDSCLEYLASQPNPVQFIDVLAGVLFEQEEPELSPAAKVELWVTLCNNRDVLVITDKSDPDMIAYATQIRKSGAQALRDGQYDLQGYETSNAAGSTAGAASHHARFMRFVDSSRMFCSNTMRMKKMNLLLLESLVKSADRFRIVMAIASHRYKGYWQHELSSDLKIAPRDLFTHLLHMSRAGVICRAAVPHDCVSRQLVKEQMEELNPRSSGRPDDGFEDKAELTSSHQSVLWFHHRYFAVGRLPPLVRELCFNRPTEALDERMLKVLHESDNQIILEDEWRDAYFAMLTEKLPWANPNVNDRTIKKSFVFFRRLLESKCKITRVFAWCPQSNTFERCVIPYGNAAELPESLEHLPTPGSKLRVVNMGAPRPAVAPDAAADDPQPDPDPALAVTFYQSPHLFFGHNMKEWVYYLVRCHKGGASVNDVKPYMSLPYKVVTKTLSSLVAANVLSKVIARDGKLLMHIYSIPGGEAIEARANQAQSVTAKGKAQTTAASAATAEQSNEDSRPAKRQRKPHTIGGVRINADDGAHVMPPQPTPSGPGAATGLREDVPETTSTPTSSTVVPELEPMNKRYCVWLTSERSLYPNEAAYEERFKALFGTECNLPKHVNTALFRRRMVLLSDYVEDFQATSCNNISVMYGDMEPHTGKTVDRKTVLRVGKYVQENRPHICLTQGHELKGVSYSLMVLYDSRRLNAFKAFQLVNNEITKRRQIKSTLTAHLRYRINESFKSPDSLPAPPKDAVNPAPEFTTGPMHLMPTTLVKDIAVTMKRARETENKPRRAFSASIQTTNGFIRPIVTRVKCLHSYLLDFAGDGRKFTATQALQNMPIDLYLQVIGCGYPLRNVYDLLEGNILRVHLDDDLYNALYLNSGGRGAIQLLRRLLAILSGIGLVRVIATPVERPNDNVVPECTLEWEVCRNVALRSLEDETQVVARFNMFKEADGFWEALRAEVEAYSSQEGREVPDHMPIQALFNPKQWKRSAFFRNVYHSHIDGTITSWLRLTFHGLDYRKLAKVMYMPDYLMDLVCQNYNVSHDHLYKHLSHRIRNIGVQSAHIGVPKSAVIYAKNMSVDDECVWLAKFVLAERMCNAMFYGKLKDSKNQSFCSPVTWGALRQKMITAMRSESAHRKRHRITAGPPGSDQVTTSAEAAPAGSITPYDKEWRRKFNDGDTDPAELGELYVKALEYKNVMRSDDDLPKVDSIDSKSTISDVSDSDPEESELSGDSDVELETTEPQPLDRIWTFLSLMFDGKFNAAACRYVFEYIIGKSLLSPRMLRRMRQLCSSDVYISLKHHSHMYRILTNESTAYDHLKCHLKSLLFSPIICMRPWFLKSEPDFRRGRNILRQWCEKGWVVNTKESTNMYTYFKLSTFAKGRLFGKYSEYEFYYNLLDSHIVMYRGSLAASAIAASDSERHQIPGSELGASISPAFTPGFMRSSDDLSMHDIYSMMNHFVNGNLSFLPLWGPEDVEEPPVAKRVKVSYERLNDGGISRHLRDCTPNVPTVVSVTVGLCAPCPMPQLPSINKTGPKTRAHNENFAYELERNREIVCGGRISEVLSPISCSSRLFGSRISCRYPLCNFEYSTDRDRGWWAGRSFTLVPVVEKALFADARSSQQGNRAAGAAPRYTTQTYSKGYKGALPIYAYFPQPKFGAPGQMAPKPAPKPIAATPSLGVLSDLLVRMIRSLYGTPVLELEDRLLYLETGVYRVVCMVQVTESYGILESDLFAKFALLYDVVFKDEPVIINKQSTTLLRAAFEVLVATAEVLRFVSRVPRNEEFAYYYWAHCEATYVKRQRIVGIRFHGTYQTPEPEEVTAAVFERPEYIPPLLWMIYEDPTALMLTPEKLAADLGRLAELVCDTEVFIRYLEQRLKSPLCSFVSLDGHLNQVLVSFLMLRIASLLKTVPGQTVVEVWEKLVILDLCEVKLVVQGMIALGICHRKPLASSFTRGVARSGVDSGACYLHFLNEDSSWLQKFYHVLYPYTNTK